MTKTIHSPSPWTRTTAGTPEEDTSATYSRTTGMHDVNMFTALTGDRDQIHDGAALAAATPFGGLILQGGAANGPLNAVVVEDLPGSGSVFLETNAHRVVYWPTLNDPGA